MLLQGGLFCISNLSPSTTLQQDFVIYKVGSKDLMTNILAALRTA